MKLHLPSKLKAALLACIGCVASLGTTLATGALIGGTFLAAVSGQAMAVDVTTSETVTADSYKENAAISITTPDGAETPTNVDVTDGGKDANGFTKGVVTVGPNATLTLSVDDALGYNKDTATPSITLKGDATHTANLVVNEHVTLSTDIILEGNALVSGTGNLDSFGGDISATGTNNTISTEIRFRKQLTIDVGDETGYTDTLKVTGVLATSDNGDKTTDTTIKKGVGTLTFDNTVTKASQNLTVGLEVREGTVSNLGTLTVSSGLALKSGAGFTNSGSLTAHNLTTEGTAYLMSSEDSYITLTGTATLASTYNDLGHLENDSDLQISGYVTADTYSKNSTGTVTVDAGHSLIIEQAGDMEWSNGGGQHYVNALLTKGSGEGTIEIHGHVGTDAGDAPASFTITGNHLVKGSMTLSRGAGGADSMIGTGSSLSIVTGAETATLSLPSGVTVAATTGNLWLKSNQDMTVNGGMLRVQNQLLLGHNENGNYPATLTLESGTVALGGLYVVNQSSGNKIEVHGGKLIIGQHGLTDKQSDGAYHLIMQGGTLGSSADSWTSNVVASFSNATIDTTKLSYTDTTRTWSEDETPKGSIITLAKTTVLTGTLTKAGVGTLAIQGNITSGGGINVTGGTLQIGDANHKSLTLVTGDITVGNGAKLWMQHSGNASVTNADGDLAGLTLNGATFYSQNADNTVSWGTLTTSGTSEIDFYDTSRHQFEKLTGGGTLAIKTLDIGDSEHKHVVRFKEIENFDGSITQANEATKASHTLIINSVNQDASHSAKIGGTTTSDDNFSKTGKGSVVFDALTLTGEGKTLSLIEGTFGVGTALSTDRATTLGPVTLGTSTHHESITLTGAVDFIGTVTNAGTLTLNGALTVSKYLGLTTTDGSFSDAETGNGFEKAKFWLVKNSSDPGVTPSLSLTATTAQVEGITNPVTVTTTDEGAYFETTDTAYHVNQGTVTYTTITAAAETAGVTLSGVSLNGGTLDVATAQNVGEEIIVTKNSVISGAATTGTDAAPNHAGISGAITVEGDGGNLTINSKGKDPSTGSAHGTFFALAGDINLGEHDLIIGSGVVRLGNINQGTADNDASIKVGHIVVEKGATLEIFRNGGDLGTDITMQGGTIRVQQVNNSGTSALALGELKVEKVTDATGEEVTGATGEEVTGATAVLSRHYYGKALSFTNLTGAGDLEISGGTGDASDGNATSFATANGFTGKLIVKDGYTKFTAAETFAGDLDVSGGTTVFAATDTFSGDITVSGGTTTFTAAADLTGDVSMTSGKVTLTGGATISKTMTVDGGTLSGNLTVTEGSKLALNKVASYTTGAISLAGGELALGVGQTYDREAAVALTSSSTLNLAEGATISESKVSGLGESNVLTLTGTGTYQKTTALTTGLNAKDTNWTGTVALSGAVVDLDLGNMGHSGSSIELSGVTGHFKNNGSKITAAVKLVDNGDVKALTFDNGYSFDSNYPNRYHVFQNKVSGTGTITNSTKNIAMNLKFTGDVKDWGGSYVHTVNTTNYLTFSGAATEVNAALTALTSEDAAALATSREENNNHRLYVTFDNTNMVSGMTVNSAITGVAEVTYTGNTTTTVNSATSNYTGGTTISGGKVAVAAGAKLGTGNVTMTSGTLILADDALANNNGTVTLAGTLGATADWSTGKAITASGNLTIDTTKYVQDAETKTYAQATGENAGANITLNGGLTLDPNAEDGTTLTIVGAGKLTLTDISGFTGTLKTSGGTLDIGSAATLTALQNVGGSTNLSTALTLGELSVTGGTVTLGKGASLAAGDSGVTVTVSDPGTLVVSSLDILGKATIAYSDGVNGFRQSVYTLVTGKTGTAFASGMVTVGTGDTAKSYELDGTGSNVTFTIDAADDTTYYVNEGESDFADATSSVEVSGGELNVADDDTVSTGAIVVAKDAEDATINLAQGATVAEGAIVVEGNATIDLADGAKIDSSVIEVQGGGKVTIAGSGDYTIHNADVENDRTVTETLSGDIAVTYSGDGVKVADKAQEYTGGTTIEGGEVQVSVQGALGTKDATVNNGATLTVMKDDVLGNIGVTLKDGATLAVDGEATTISNQITYGENANVKFDANGQEMTVSSSTEGAAGITAMGGGTVKLTQAVIGGGASVPSPASLDPFGPQLTGNAPGAGTTYTAEVGTPIHFDSSDDGGTKGIMLESKDCTNAGVINGDGSTKNAQVTAAAGAVLATGNTLIIGEGSELVLTSGADGYVPMSVTGTLTFGEGSILDLTAVTPTFDNGDFTLITGTSGNIVLADNMTFSGLGLGMRVIVAKNGNLVVQQVEAQGPFYITGVVKPEPDAPNSNIVTFKTNISGTISGNVEINFQTWGEDMWAGQYMDPSLFYSEDGVLVRLQDASGQLIDLKDVTKLTINGYDGFKEADGLANDGNSCAVYVKGENAFGQYYGPSIPEPTTTTLSLLALAGLAARRRRQQA